jgi:hypothetical protein
MIAMDAPILLPQLVPHSAKNLPTPSPQLPTLSPKLPPPPPHGLAEAPAPSPYDLAEVLTESVGHPDDNDDGPYHQTRERPPEEPEAVWLRATPRDGPPDIARPIQGGPTYCAEPRIVQILRTTPGTYHRRTYPVQKLSPVIITLVRSLHLEHTKV